MKDIYIKIIAIVLTILIILVSFNFIRQIQINDIVQKVEKRSFSVRILSDKTTGTNPITINFESIVLNEEGKLKYSWDFGNGNTSEEVSPSNLYEKGGNYTCKLVVTDEKGNKAEDSINIIIDNNKPPVVVLTLNENIHERIFIPILSMIPLYAGDKQKVIDYWLKTNPNLFGEGTVVCTAQVNDPENNEIVSYEWVHRCETQVGKFTKTEQPTYYISGNNSILLPELTCWPMGRHVITLTVKDSIGNQANASIEFQVEESMKKIQRDLMKGVIKGAKNTWVVSLKPFLGPTVAVLLLAMWKYNNFEGIKLVTILILQGILQIDMGDSLMIELKAFLDGHARIAQKFDKILIKMQEISKNQTIDDSIEQIREDFGFANKRPIIFNPFPEDETNNIPIDIPYVAINVSDLEGDPFNITISGEYVNNVTYTDVTNGTFIATLITPLPEREEIFWNVEVVDPRGKIVTGEYKFTTFVEI